MRAKFAAQIREGIVAAKYDVSWTVNQGYPPPVAQVFKTDLERKAYDRTLKILLWEQLDLSLNRMGTTLQKMTDKGWLDASDD